MSVQIRQRTLIRFSTKLLTDGQAVASAFVFGFKESFVLSVVLVASGADEAGVERAATASCVGEQKLE